MRELAPLGRVMIVQRGDCHAPTARRGSSKLRLFPHVRTTTPHFNGSFSSESLIELCSSGTTGWNAERLVRLLVTEQMMDAQAVRCRSSKMRNARLRNSPGTVGQCRQNCEL